jgi:polyisoprenoid-binding protein YceI
MKAILLFSAALVATSLASCGGGSDDAAATADSTATVMNYTIDPAASTLGFTGTMLGVKAHTGTLNFTSGSFSTDKGLLTGGEFTVDMKNYTLADTNYAPDGSEQGTKANLMGHLMSGDFFNVDSFPTAALKITSVTGNTATADLTVRGITNSETITDIVITPNEADGSVKATGKLTFDRQKYGVAWSSGSQDYVLGDNIDITVELSGKSR